MWFFVRQNNNTLTNMDTGYHGIPSGDLTWLWKITMSNGYINIYQLEMAMFHSYVKLPEGTFQFSRITLWSYHRPSHLSRQTWAFDAHTLGIDRIDQFTLDIATETTTLDSHLGVWNSVFNCKNKWPTEAPTIATEWQELIGEVLSVICNPLFRREGSPGTWCWEFIQQTHSRA